MTVDCLPPEIACRRGRHRIVRIPSGGGQARHQAVGEDEYVDEDGNLLRRYDIDDNPSLFMSMPRPIGSVEGTQ